ncbi:MAG: PilZ domain-containing protein [Lachnospiraceae bacterium]|nr:PilZ domain-containing protein [Lachnospiraceae bacterium]
MSYERRNYSRLKSGMSCLVYYNNVEFVGVVDNLSEAGLGILINETEACDLIGVGDKIDVTGLDAEVVIQFEANIARISKMEDKVYIGAQIINQKEIEPYINRKRVELFLGSITDRQ